LSRSLSLPPGIKVSYHQPLFNVKNLTRVSRKRTSRPQCRTVY
jgi:hypothetical protein